jgi:inosose dehydratase
METSFPQSFPQSTSRRSFLKLGAAALAASAVGVPRLWAADGSGEYGGLRMGIQSYSLRDRPFDKMLEAMQHDLKLRYVELFPAHMAGRTSPQIKELLKKHNVTAASYGVVPFGKDEKKNREMFEIAKTYGMKNLSCNPEPNDDTFASLEKLTEEYGITVAIHPHGPEDKNWGKIAQLQKGFEGRSTRIGLCNDTGHLIRSNEDPLKACQLFKDRLHALHLKDFNKEGKDVPAGQGRLDVDGIVKFLLDKSNGFKGTVFIEYEGGEPVEAIRKSLARVKESVKKAKGDA